MANDQLNKAITFTTKAESKFAVVAIASIMARYIFLREMDKLSETYHTEFPKGASNKVDAFGKDLVHQHGQAILKKVAKYHFKNTDKIID